MRTKTRTTTTSTVSKHKQLRQTTTVVCQPQFLHLLLLLLIQLLLLLLFLNIATLLELLLPLLVESLSVRLSIRLSVQWQHGSSWNLGSAAVRITVRVAVAADTAGRMAKQFEHISFGPLQKPKNAPDRRLNQGACWRPPKLYLRCRCAR